MSERSSDPLLGVIDVGTNSVRFLATRGAERALERNEITRLGEGCDASRVLSPAAMERTLAAIALSVAAFREAGGDPARALRAVGTSALRDAGNGGDFARQVERACGVRLEIVSGVREASLVARGVAGAQSLAGPFLLFDVGGGSTEVVAGRDARVDFLESVDLGALRVTERRGRPRDAAEAAALRDSLVPAFADLARHAPEGASAGGVFGLGGTITTLAALSLGLDRYDAARVEGARLSDEEIETLLVRLAAMPLEDLAALPGMEPGRAGVIVAGTAIVSAVMRGFLADAVRVSTRGIRHGVLAELRTEAAGAAG
jgi:exopolyphosphatase/guanosine-5'-triphosphate,3'-diphosphate pyrophosphatase